MGLSREKLSRAENRQPECHWRHCCASHGPFLLLDGQDVCSKVIHRVAIEGGARFGVCPATPLLAASPIPGKKHNLERKLGPVNMAAVRKVLHSGQRLLFIHRAASHPAAFRLTKMSTKHYSDTVTHTGQVSAGSVTSA